MNRPPPRLVLIMPLALAVYAGRKQLATFVIQGELDASGVEGARVADYTQPLTTPEGEAA